ncbi:MAG: TonB-dependent receptor [Candidatus Pseudobacter hemicellulosilyticus]|uniref:TonB-dependent receptor n=1 Tax=Candidatus Pseudobacter hemicellulosilyticus TaxID=3121375 RepID=A0AAJ5WXL6_9BACT|nr:MAG: TonB-dependent receptor [Pseudobacter sp.]
MFTAQIRFAALFLMLSFFHQNLTAQHSTKTVTGTVVDDQGNPLPNATIKSRSQERNVLTNENGFFTIVIPASDTVLVVSYVGMQTREFPIRGNGLQRIVLSGVVNSLSDVVVIGYGTARKANLTTAQTSISAKELNRTVNTTIEQAMQGRAPGVYITQNSGQPGGGMSVNIRGIASIFGTTEPLYVVDGVQLQPTPLTLGAQSSSNPLAGFNPGDIEDIQILQGPSATAIYGSRATNGVVLITTRRGKSGDVRIGYNFQQSIQGPPKKLDVMNLREYAQMVKEYHVIAGGETPLEFLDPSLLGDGTDWQKELFGNAPMAKHQLTLSGGTDKSTYYISADYLDQKGVAEGSGFKRTSFRLNLDNKLSKRINLGLNLSYNQTKENLTTSQENIIINALQLSPQVPVKNLDGTWGGADENNGANIYAPVNPLAIASMVTNENNRKQFLGGANLTVKLLEGLQFRTSFSTDLNYSLASYFIPKYKIGWAENPTASFTNRSTQSTYWNWNQLLEYNKTWGEHHLTVMASHEAQKSEWRNLSGGRTGFLTNNILDLSAGDNLTSVTAGGSSLWAMESYLARAQYNYADRYLLSASFRADGSANFGPENRWGYFPSASAAWRVSNEKFFTLDFISELKLRLEGGLTGNQGGGSYIYSPLVAGVSPNGTGFLPSRYKNPGLKWEETMTRNIGLNIGFAKNRIEIEADYYLKATNNLLLEATVPWYMGSNGTGSISPQVMNIGELENKGWSVTLKTVNIRNKDFTWSSNLNLSAFKTSIKKFYNNSAKLDRTSWWLDNWTQRSVVGEAPWLFLGYKEDGLFTSIDDINESPVPVDNDGKRLPVDPVTGIWVGDVKFKDISGPNGVPDGIIDSYDLTFIGNPWPKLFGGFTNTFSYKGFDLSVLITGTYGNDVYNYAARVNSNPNNINLSRNLLKNAMNYARVVDDGGGKAHLDNPGTDVARISHGPNNNYTRITDKWVEDGSFLRVKNITLTYNFSPELLRGLKIVQGARIGFSAQNLLTLTGYNGMDPEIGSYTGRDAAGTNQAIGIDNGRYPLTPVYTFSFGIDF